MYLIMELCKGGELSLKLREKTYFKEEVTLCVATALPFMELLCMKHLNFLTCTGG